MSDALEVARTSADVMWSGDAASRALGMEVVDVGPGTAVVTMTVRADMVNGWDICHGGLIATLADSTFALACNSHGTVTVASGFEITFLEPAHLGDELRAAAAERSTRGRLGVYDVTVVRVGDGATLAELRGRSHATGRPISG